MSVNFRHENNLGIVELNNPPVNAIGHAMRQGLLDAVRAAEKLYLDRVIVIGLGRAFAAGADAREFDQPAQEPHLPDVLNAIDESFVPWIAAINGVALGGGAEIAMACRMRIMHPTAQIGMPEVTLGVIPGAGGTQRLPRLVGLEHALDMITSGRPISAQKALEIGLVHDIDADVFDAAFLVNTEDLGCRVPTWELPAPDWDDAIAEKIAGGLAKKARGQIAPVTAIEVMKQGLALDFHDALNIERAAFLSLRTGSQSRALRHMFFAERSAKAPDHLTAEPVKVTTVAVVGGGTMGSGIAYACLSAGFKLCLLETDAHGVERAQHNVEKIISDSQQRGLLSDSRAGELRNNITYSTTYADAAQAELAIEAAFESIEVKRDVFQSLEANLAPTAILASNTSYLDLNDIAGCVSDPSRVVGLHFFAPAHVMKLLEIIKGDATSDRAMATAFAMGKALRKIPVLAGVCDGFIGNRILTRYREAGDVLLMDGAVHWDVDEAMVEFGYAMGPYEVQDLSGLDIAYANRRRHDATRDPNRRYIPIADRMVQEGRLGKKTGVGWYRYPGGGGRVDDPLVEDLIREESHFAKVTRREIGKDEITKTLLLAMINEAANILYEGIAQSAADIDLVTVFGYGFPRWRGGLMHYADEVGVDNIVRDLTELAKTDPIAWAVSPALIYCAQAGITLMQYRR